jgi:hypothetical protein
VLINPHSAEENLTLRLRRNMMREFRRPSWIDAGSWCSIVWTPSSHHLLTS